MKESPEEMQVREIPKEMQATFDDWERKAIIWKRFHYGLGVTGIAASILASSSFFNLVEQDVIAGICSIISAFCFGVMGFTIPAVKSLSYERALSHIKVPLMHYRIGENYALKHVFQAQQEAEGVILSRDTVGGVPSAPQISK